MTADASDGNAPLTVTGQVSHWFGQAAQIVSGISGFSYAFGWVVAARFYGSFAVAPEEVGVSFGWLAIRAFLVGITGLAIFLMARSLLRAAERSQPVVHMVHSRVAIIVLTVASCVGAAAVVALGLTMWVATEGGTVGTASVVAVLACGGLIALVILWLRPPAVQLGWNSSLWLRGGAGVLLGLITIGLLLLPYRLADHMAADVRSGRTVHLPVVPEVTGLQVIRVRLGPADGQKPPPDISTVFGCVLQLGGNAGTSIYYVDGRVLRVADQNVTVVAPC